jgi:hypothetical protein
MIGIYKIPVQELADSTQALFFFLLLGKFWGTAILRVGGKEWAQ